MNNDKRAKITEKRGVFASFSLFSTTFCLYVACQPIYVTCKFGRIATRLDLGKAFGLLRVKFMIASAKAFALHKMMKAENNIFILSIAF